MRFRSSSPLAWEGVRVSCKDRALSERESRLSLCVARVAHPSKTTAGFWWVRGTAFFIVRSDCAPLVIDLPNLLCAFTTKRSTWRIWARTSRGEHHLAALGLDKADFPTRREALRHLTFSFEPFWAEVERGVKEMTAEPFAD